MIQSVPPARFRPGPELKPFNKLLEWLNRQTPAVDDLAEDDSRMLLRLPVVVRFDADSRLDIRDAFIGTSESDLDNESIFLSFDDTGMGDSLISELDDLCPEPANVCAVWVEGLWGALVEPDLVDFAIRDEAGEIIGWPFAVLKVLGLINEHPEIGDPARIYVEED